MKLVDQRKCSAHLVCLLLCLVIVEGEGQECPRQCGDNGCRWRSGRYYLECVNKNLLNIPPVMKSSTQFDDQVIVVAQFDGNALQLQDDGLYKLGYHHLQEVSMENCLLLTVPPRFFSYLKLRKINLRRNMLKEIRSDTFSELDQLTFLDLSFNTLTHIDQVFEATDFVTKIFNCYCSGCVHKPRQSPGVEPG